MERDGGTVNAFQLDENTCRSSFEEGLDDIHQAPLMVTTTSYTFPKWGDSTANEDTAPTMTCRADLRDHVFYNQRYVVTGGEIVSFSETDTSSTSSLTALLLWWNRPIQLRYSSEVSSPTEWLLTIDETLLIWSRTSQFQVRPVDGEVISLSTSLW